VGRAASASRCSASASFDQIASLGVAPVAMVVFGVSTTILVSLFLAQRLKLSRTFSVLSGGVVAICGVAALASPRFAAQRAKQTRHIFDRRVSNSAVDVAMIVYPIVGTAVSTTARRHLLGGAIHDVAQVVGAGYMISPETGDVATYVKMLRVAMLLPCAAIARPLRASTPGVKRRTPLLPMFLLAFATLVAINSTGLIPKGVGQGANDISRWCLVTAIAALGMKTSFKDLIAVGWRPVGLMVVETVWIAVVVLIAVTWLI
jgi:uncharacterized integral membrane protein (TIGR00698 family)